MCFLVQLWYICNGLHGITSQKSIIFIIICLITAYSILCFQIHNKSHEGEKCFKCDLCPYASISQRHLESHMLIHTDQKPYQCDQCDQSFRQKQLLRRHQNLYHNPNYVPPPPREKTHECPECGRAFRHKGNLIRHMAVHDPESSAQEKALALKLGRQKKIQVNTNYLSHKLQDRGV